MSTSNQLTQFWIEFLELYKSLPVLWKTGHDGYSHKHSRAAAYETLLVKYQEFDEGANMDNLKNKINNLRTSFRRESKKVEEDSTYTPTLWYYPHMLFITSRDEDDEENGEGGDGGDSEETYSTRIIKREEVEMKRLPQPKKPKQSHTSSIEHTPHKRRFQKMVRSPTISNHNATSSIQTSSQNISQSDEAKALSATWEVLYRNLPSHQKLYANRVITEVLYLGALRRLNENSYKAFEDHTNSSQNQENPINITIDSINCDNNDGSKQLSNVTEALNNLKHLENYAVRENHEAIDLIIQLEEMLKGNTVDVLNEADEDQEEEDEEEEEHDDDDDEDFEI